MNRKFVRRRRALAAIVAAVVLVAGYFLWFRDSSLVSVNEVVVDGATTSEAELDDALTRAADGMSTLNVDEDVLVRTAAQFPTVASIAVDSSPPHKLTVRVTERLPVGQVKVEGERTAIADDGYLLPGVEVEGAGLVPLDEDAEAEGPRLNEEGTAQAEILGGAPDELSERIEGAEWDPERGGVVIALEGAPELRFGDGADAEKKWRAAVAVLAAAEGAPAYVDVSVPERSVSGG